MDAYSIRGTPVKDVVQWEGNLALMGALPDTFHAFMQKIGHPYAKVKPLVRALTALLWKHLSSQISVLQLQLARQTGEANGGGTDFAKDT